MANGGQASLEDPVAQELLRSTVPARLAYVWKDGTPRVVPIWFHWDGQDVVFGSFVGAPKTKALQTGDAVAVTIDTNDYPHKVLLLRGTVTVEVVEGIVEEYALAAKRYFGDEQGEAWIAGMPEGVDMVRIAMRPEKVRILDFQTRFPSALSG